MKEYLLYLFGELTEYHSEKYSDTRYWKNDEYGVVLELEKSGALWVYHKIWWNFSDFFSLQYTEKQQVMKDVLEEHLKLVEKNSKKKFFYSKTFFYLCILKQKCYESELQINQLVYRTTHKH